MNTYIKNERKVKEVTGVVKQSGTGGHIILPRDWVGVEVVVKVKQNG